MFISLVWGIADAASGSSPVTSNLKIGLRQTSKALFVLRGSNEASLQVSADLVRLEQELLRSNVTSVSRVGTVTTRIHGDGSFKLTRTETAIKSRQSLSLKFKPKPKPPKPDSAANKLKTCCQIMP